MTRLTLILSVITAVIALLGGFRYVVDTIREMRWRKRQTGRWLLLLLLCVLPTNGEAACTGASPNWTSTIDETSMNTCVNTNAIAGDTITVTSGSASWGTDGFQIASQPSNLTIVCDTPGGCSVSDGGFRITTTDSISMSGFVFTCDTSTNVYPGGCVTIEGSINFRFHHNTINNTSWATPIACIWVLGSLNGTDSLHESYGLIDNNTLNNCRVLTWGEFTGSGGKDRWVEHGSILGTQYNVFIEDNVYTIAAGTPGPGGLACDNSGRVLCNFTDVNIGGGAVVRFNTVHNSYFEHHSTTGWDGRGTKNYEVYYNATDLAASFKPNFSRMFSYQAAGSGVAFKNHATDNYSIHDIDVDYIKRKSPDGENASSEQCNGSHVSDQNSDSFGYVCLDQWGTSHDTTKMTSATAVGQVKRPHYSWDNDMPAASQILVSTASASVDNIIHRDRDYFEKDPSRGTFDGTFGVGTGTRAARPSTCTTGVGYWSTDQGSWNQSTTNPYGVQANGADGVLDVCTATDTWTNAYYTPYTYPHPLQGAAAPASFVNPSIQFYFSSWALLIESLSLAGVLWHARSYLLTGLLVMGGWISMSTTLALPPIQKTYTLSKATIAKCVLLCVPKSKQ